MAQATILWQPTVKEGERLLIEGKHQEQFMFQMQTAFPRDWPMQLTNKDLERLEGMAASCTVMGNPYLTLVSHLKRYKAITVWPDWGKEKSE
jgi:hypothetical protein